MLYLHNLPEELLEYIVTLLGHDPPSSTTAAHEPLAQDLFSRKQPLKNLSLVSKTWRRLTKPALFKHIRVRAEELLPPSHSLHDDGNASRSGVDYPNSFSPSHGAFAFLDFLKDHIPIDGTRSLVIYTTVGNDSFKAFRSSVKDVHLKSILKHVLTAANPDRLILLCPPATLTSLTDCTANFADAAAFDIPYQRIELSQTPKQHSIQAPFSSPCSPIRELEDTTTSLLVTTPWDYFSYNAGSSMNVYGTYHYFEKRPPCILHQGSVPCFILWQSLKSFSYTAVFPHYVHFEQNVINSMKRMKVLERIYLRLAPDASSHVLNDTDHIGRGNLNLRDCWAEVDRAYHTVIRELLLQKEHIKEFTSYDCEIPAFEDALNNLFEFAAIDQWAKCDRKTWKLIDSGSPTVLPGRAD